MKLSDQTIKQRVIALIAALSLIGFVLEIGPVGGVFSLVNNGPSIVTGLLMELAVLGFVAYLALAASAALGLHPAEDEPKEKEEARAQAPTTIHAPGEAESVQEQVRVRPDIHQLRMLFTALGGFVLLKGITLVFMWPRAQESGLTASDLLRLMQFGFVFTALSWFVMWQFLRWFVQRRRWVRLQNELVGADVARIIAVVVLIRPIWYLVTAAMTGQLAVGALNVVTLLLYLSLVAIAVVLWQARPFTLARTVASLGVIGGVIVILTVILAVLEVQQTG